MTTCSRCGTQAADGQQTCARCGVPLASAAEQPRHGQDAQSDQAQQPGYGQGGYGQSNDGQPGLGVPQPPAGYGQQPQYNQPQYGPPQPPPAGYGPPQYNPPQPPPAGYGQPQYGQPQYGQPQYGQPQYGQPQYGQPQYGESAAMPAITWRSGQIVAGRPLELAAVAGLIGLAALYFIWNGVKLLINLFGDFAPSGLPLVTGLLGVVLILSIGAAVGAVALMVFRGDPAGRILAWVTAAILVWSFAYAGGMDVWAILILLAAITWSGGLIALPAVTDTFANSPVPTATVDVSVARRLAFVLGYFLILVALLVFLVAKIVSDYGVPGNSVAKGIIYGIIFLAIGIGAFVVSRRLEFAATKWMARMVLTVGCAIALIVLFLQHDSLSDLGVVIGLTVAIPVALWARAETRAYFDEGRPAAGAGSPPYPPSSPPPPQHPGQYPNQYPNQYPGQPGQPGQGGEWSPGSRG